MTISARVVQARHRGANKIYPHVENGPVGLPVNAVKLAEKELTDLRVNAQRKIFVLEIPSSMKTAKCKSAGFGAIGLVDYVQRLVVAER